MNWVGLLYVAMDGNTSSSGGGVQNYRGCLQVALAALLTEAGFDSVDRMAIESLTEMATAIINEIGRALLSQASSSEKFLTVLQIAVATALSLEFNKKFSYC